MSESSSRLHSRSLLVGLGIAAAFLVLSSFTPTPLAKTLRILVDPEPSSIVRIHEGDSFVVPIKQHLVLKAGGDAGTFGGFGGALIRVNGAAVLTVRIEFEPMVTLPFPLVAHAGDVVTLEDVNADPNFQPFVTGYLSE